MYRNARIRKAKILNHSIQKKVRRGNKATSYTRHTQLYVAITYITSLTISHTVIILFFNTVVLLFIGMSPYSIMLWYWHYKASVCVHQLSLRKNKVLVITCKCAECISGVWHGDGLHNAGGEGFV